MTMHPLFHSDEVQGFEQGPLVRQAITLANLRDRIEGLINAGVDPQAEIESHYDAAYLRTVIVARDKGIESLRPVDLVARVHDDDFETRNKAEQEILRRLSEAEA